jgi:DNA-binding response OmpR family regulator
MAYIMVVEDNEDLATVAAYALSDEGHEVVTKFDTASALKEMQRRAPDLVVLDVMFPGNDWAGFELAREMSKLPDLKGIPIIMTTGVNQTLGSKFDSYDIDDSWLPVTEFLEKPVDMGQLVSKVKAILEGKGHHSS